MIHGLKPFWIWLRICWENRQSWLHSGVNDPAVHITQLCISQRCQWHRCATNFVENFREVFQTLLFFMQGCDLATAIRDLSAVLEEDFSGETILIYQLYFGPVYSACPQKEWHFLRRSLDQKFLCCFRYFYIKMNTFQGYSCSSSNIDPP
jgi:hypothetical protein